MEREFLGPKLVQVTNEVVQKIKAIMFTTQSRHESGI